MAVILPQHRHQSRDSSDVSSHVEFDGAANTKRAPPRVQFEPWQLYHKRVFSIGLRHHGSPPIFLPGF